MTGRLTLRHGTKTFLDRWRAIELPILGIYVHKIADRDPGLDLHDHPWWFASIIIRGSYFEHRCNVREIEDYHAAPVWPLEHRRRWSIRSVRLDEAHRIVGTENNRPAWSIIIRGRKVRTWGFYLPLVDGSRSSEWVAHTAYDYATRRPLTEQDR